MKGFFKTLLHAAISSAVVGAAAQVTSGGPITSGNVLLPALLAGGLGALHAAMPSTLTPSDPPPSVTPKSPFLK